MPKKISPFAIYGGLILVILVVVFILVNVDGEQEPENKTDITEQQMPDDSIHSKFKNQGQMPPGMTQMPEEFKKELETLKSEIEENPEDTAAMRQYAELLMRGHKVGEAEEYLKTILDKDPNRIDIMFSLSVIYFNQQDYDKTEKLNNTILKLDPENLNAVYNKGAIAMARGKMDEAVSIWQDIIDNHPGSEAAKIAEQSITKVKQQSEMPKSPH